MNKYYSVVTDIGTAAIANAVVLGEKVDIVDFAVGDGGGSFYQPVPSTTALKEEKWRGKVSSVEVVSGQSSENLLRIIAILPSSVGGFTIREMGAFDTKGQLIAISNTPDMQKVAIAEGVSSELQAVIEIAVSNASVINWTVDPNVIIASKRDLQRHDEAETAHGGRFAKAVIVTEHMENKEIHVNKITMGNYDIAISGLIAHTEDTDIHTTAEDKLKWDEGAEVAKRGADEAAMALNKCAELESRIARLEDGLFSNITENPFLISFDTLAKVILTKGVWNVAKKRVEC